MISLSHFLLISTIKLGFLIGLKSQGKKSYYSLTENLIDNFIFITTTKIVVNQAIFEVIYVNQEIQSSIFLIDFLAPIV